MYHKIIIAGNLGRDPEMRYTNSGQAVTNLSVATSNKWTGQDGQSHDETIWWRVSVWGKQAEICKNYLAKGRQVLVEGRISGDRIPSSGGGEQIVPRVWTGQDGQPRASYEITAQTVRFIGGRDDRVAGPSAPEYNEEPPAEADDDIPF